MVERESSRHVDATDFGNGRGFGTGLGLGKSGGGGSRISARTNSANKRTGREALISIYLPPAPCPRSPTFLSAIPRLRGVSHPPPLFSGLFSVCEGNGGESVIVFLILGKQLCREFIVPCGVFCAETQQAGRKRMSYTVGRVFLESV
ncbi:unnamed protein product, partial [Ectocarpus sp. 13 AM-2016]